jgi:hypothetical protein
MCDILASLTNQEIAILQATKASEKAQTAEELATNAEIYPAQATPAISSLVQRSILESYEQEWDSTMRYMYAGNDYAQAVYDALYGPLELG